MRAAGPGGARDRAHARHAAAAADQAVPAARQLGADGGGQLDVRRVDPAAGGAEDADRRHYSGPLRAASSSGSGATGARVSAWSAATTIRTASAGSSVTENRSRSRGVDLAAGQHRGPEPVDQARPSRRGRAARPGTR